MMDFNQILTEAIEKYVEAILQNKLNAIAERLQALESDSTVYANQIYEMKSEFREIVQNEIEDYDFSEIFTNSIDEHNFKPAISEALNDFGMTDCVVTALANDSDLVHTAVEDYLSKRTFNLVRNN
jgi:hypothetical protein